MVPTPSVGGPAPRVEVGPLRLWSPVILAPMAGVTDAPFRRLCRGFGEQGLPPRLRPVDVPTDEGGPADEGAPVAVPGVDAAREADRAAQPRRRPRGAAVRALMMSLLGTGVLVPIVGATVRHWWTKRLQRREDTR